MMATKFTVYLIDNYDSFTYNLYQYVGEHLQQAQCQGHLSDFEIIVKRNNEVTLAEITQAKPDRIIISPGPGTPGDKAYFGICEQVISQLGPHIPLLGVCLGMQGIAYSFGGAIVKACVPMHGKTSLISHTQTGLFAGIPQGLEIMRYHSLMVDPHSLPECFRVTAQVACPSTSHIGHVLNDNKMEIMAVEHKQYPVYGIQFHPESHATEGGKEIIANFLFSV